MFEIPDIQLNQYGKPARIMFLAPYAPDAPDFSKKPYTGNGGYPQYHYNIYKAIQDIGYNVVSSGGSGMEEGKAFPYFLDIPLETRLTYCSMAGSSCSMHSTSFSCVRQRMRLWFGRETLKYGSPSR